MGVEKEGTYRGIDAGGEIRGGIESGTQETTRRLIDLGKKRGKRVRSWWSVDARRRDQSEEREDD